MGLFVEGSVTLSVGFVGLSCPTVTSKEAGLNFTVGATCARIM